MIKKYFLLLFMTLLMCTFVSAWYEPVVYYEFGDDGIDSSISYKDSLVNSGAAFAAGIIGQSINGGTGTCENTSLTGARMSTIRTLDWWMKTDTGNFGYPVRFGGTDDTNHIYIQDGSNLHMRISYEIGDARIYDLIGSTNIPTNEWVHYVYTVNNSGAFLYENGVVVDSKGATNTITSDFTTMKHAYASSANTYIDNFAMFNVSYSKANVTTSYNASHGVNFTAMNEVPPPPAVITNSSWNYTNTNIISGENTNGWNNAGIINITSNAASFTFTASLSSNWTCGPYDANHTWYLDNYPDALLATTDATAQSETAYHFNLSYGNQCIYCSANLFQTNNSHSGCLNIDRYDYPTVTLVSPEDNSIDTDGEINFSYEPIGYYNDIANCSLWGNWSGSWIVNQTNISVIINDSTNWFDTINLTEANYKWNVQCCNEKGICNFSATNYSFKIDNIKPSIIQINNNGCINLTSNDNQICGWYNYSTNYMDLIFSYNLTSINMSDGCDGEINLSPTVTYDLEICLQNDSVEVPDSCNTYTSGTYGVGNTLQTSPIDITLLYDDELRLEIHWKRIGYVDMNNSDLNGEYDHGISSTDTINSACLGPTEPWGLYEGSHTCSREVRTGTLLYVYETNDCTGTDYSEYSQTAGSTCRTYEGYNRTGGNTSTLNDAWAYNGFCLLYCSGQTYSYKRCPGCNCETILSDPVWDSLQTIMYDSCSIGIASSCPSNLCTYAGDYNTYTSIFNIDDVSINSSSKLLTKGTLSTSSTLINYIDGYTLCGPTNDGTPTIEFTLDEDADCRLSDEQLNYTDMNVTMDCSTTGGTSQECTMYKTLSNGIIPLYLACNDSAGNMQDYVLSDPAYTFNISINNPPVITLNKPDDNITKYVADILITFNFTVTDDASPTLNCSLYINNILNQTNSSVLNNNLTNFLPIYLSRGTWIWNVTCIENVGDLLEDTEIRTLYVNNTLPTWLHNISNVSINRTSGTTVYLTNLTDYVTDADNDIIYFTVENENVSEVDCNIVGNTNLTLSPYDFWYGNASCIIGINDSYGYGENRTVNVEVLSVDTIKPIIYLINPTNNSRTVGTYTELRFNVSDSSIITNCTLYINGTLNQTDTSITKDISQSFYIYTGKSNSYSWNISCLDYYNNSNTTQYNIFRVNTPSSTSSLVSPENASYVGGDTNLLDWNASTDNESDSISYYVWYSMTNPPSYSFYTTSTSSYVDTSTSGTYYWYIKSYDGYEFSDSSDIFRFTTSLDVPTVTRISPESNLLTDDSSILFNVSVTDDNLDTSETKLNLGGTWYNLIDYIVSGSTYYFWRTITGLTEQNYSYYFTARNNLGVLGSSSTDYAAVNYSAYINIPYTGSIGPYGSIYWKPATGYNITYVAPDGMSATNYTFSMTNNDDTRNGTVLIKVDSNYTTYKLCCNDIYDNSSCIGIDDNYISINNSLYAGDTCYVWCWMNYTNPTSVWNGNIYVNMKGV